MTSRPTPHGTPSLAGAPGQPGTPSLLRSMNDRTALALLLEHGALTRAQIGELTGLSRPTASKVISRLEDAGLVDVVGESRAARGPEAVTYGARGDRVQAVAVDVRPHSVLSTVVDALGSEHPVARTELSRSAADRSALRDIELAVHAACGAAGTDVGTVATVVVGLQGAVDPRTDTLAFTGNLPGWPRRSVRAQLEDGLGMAVQIDNDVNLAAVAERAVGAGRGTDGFALLWLGDGLGVAVDLGGRLHRGASGGAGEIGYLPVPRALAQVDPRARDLQALIGGAAVVRLAREHGVHGRTPDAVLAALATHPAREAVLAELAPRVAAGVVPVLAVLDPPLVVLGGPTGTAGGALLADLVRGHIRRTTGWSPQVSASTVTDHPVLRGARSVVGDDLRERLLDLVT